MPSLVQFCKISLKGLRLAETLGGFECLVASADACFRVPADVWLLDNPL